MNHHESDLTPYDQMVMDISQAQMAAEAMGPGHHDHDPTLGTHVQVGGVSIETRADDDTVHASQSVVEPGGSGKEIRVNAARGRASGSIRYFGPDGKVVSEQKLDTLSAYEQVSALAQLVTREAGVVGPAVDQAHEAVRAIPVKVTVLDRQSELKGV